MSYNIFQKDFIKYVKVFLMIRLHSNLEINSSKIQAQEESK